MNAKDLKLVVKEKYGEIASQTKQQNESSCCGASGCCSTVDYAVFSEEEITGFKTNETGIFSITVSGYKQS